MKHPILWLVALLLCATAITVWLVREPRRTNTPAAPPRSPDSPSPKPSSPASTAPRPSATAPRPTSNQQGSIQRPFCRNDSDCEANQLCFRSRIPPSSWGTCLVGECRVDADCRANANCLRDGAATRCVEHGTQTEGATCSFKATATDAERCSSGLICVGLCVRPCEILDDGTDTCPPGDLCKSTANGNVCTMSCDPRRCAEGETCVLDGLRSHCGRRIGPDCERFPCSAGRVCATEWDEKSHTLFSECRAPCSATGPSCSTGSVCSITGPFPGFCVHTCRTDDDCGRLGLCQPITTAGEKGCVRFDQR